MSKNDFTKLKLKNVKVEFWNKGNEKFKPSIVISADDPAVKKKITQWVEDNRIGEGELVGKALFAKYKPDGEDGKTYYRYTFRVTDRTKIKGVNNLGASDIGRGSRVSLVANAFEYKTQFGSGVSKSVTAIKVLTPADDSNDRDLVDLMDDTDDEDIELDDFDEIEDDTDNDDIKPEDIPEF